LALAAVLGLLAVSNAQAAITLALAANVGSTIKFVGDGTSSTFTLQPNSTPQFTVTSTFGGVGDGAGVITGSIISSGFTYQVAGITTIGPLQTAPLTGSGTLTLTTGAETLTADIVGLNIQTAGTLGGVNSLGSVNLSNLVLSGSGNSDLTQFYTEAVANAGTASLTFQFIPAQSLTELAAVGTNENSYSGTITSVVPEPGPIGMALSAVAGLGGLGDVRRRKPA